MGKVWNLNPVNAAAGFGLTRYWAQIHFTSLSASRPRCLLSLGLIRAETVIFGQVSAVFFPSASGRHTWHWVRVHNLL